MTTSEEFFTPPDTRVFFQKGPTRPGAPYEYLGTGETQDTTPKVGSRTAIRIQSRAQRGAFDIVGQQYAVPDLHTTGIHMLLPRTVASILEDMYHTKCPASFQVVLGKCNTPDEFHLGWESKFLYEGAEVDELTIPGMPSVDGSKLTEVYVDGSMTFVYFDRILSIRFAEKAGSEVLAEVLDGLFAGMVSCGDCGPYSEGNDHFYAITRANPASPGLSGRLVYTIDGSAFTSVDIPTLGGLDPNKIAAAGDFLIVISENAGNLQYVRRQDVIAATDWVAVSSGFVAAHGPRGIYVKSPGEVFICGAAGYIYKATNFKSLVEPIELATLTSEDFNGIHGHGNVLVAVADNNDILVSSNLGDSFSLMDGPLAGSDLNTVCVIDDVNWIVGGDGGAFYRTPDAGTNWYAIPFSLAGVGAIIHDVKFADKSKQALYAAIEVGGRGYVFRSTDAGDYWTNDEPAIISMPTNARLRFVAPSPNSINVCGTGGLAAAGTDGFLAIGS